MLWFWPVFSDFVNVQCSMFIGFIFSCLYPFKSPACPTSATEKPENFPASPELAARCWLVQKPHWNKQTKCNRQVGAWLGVLSRAENKVAQEGWGEWGWGWGWGKETHPVEGWGKTEGCFGLIGQFCNQGSKFLSLSLLCSQVASYGQYCLMLLYFIEKLTLELDMASLASKFKHICSNFSVLCQASHLILLPSIKRVSPSWKSCPQLKETVGLYSKDS